MKLLMYSCKKFIFFSNFFTPFSSSKIIEILQILWVFFNFMSIVFVLILASRKRLKQCPEMCLQLTSVVTLTDRVLTCRRLKGFLITMTECFILCWIISSQNLSFVCLGKVKNWIILYTHYGKQFENFSIFYSLLE